MRAASASPRWFSMPASSATRPASGCTAEQTNAGGIQRSSRITRRSAVTSVMRASADAQIAGAFLGLQHVAQPRAADLQLGRDGGGGLGVVRLERMRAVTAFGTVVGDFHPAGLADRQRQIHQRVARAVRDIERRRMVGLAGQHERRAVLEHAGCR